MKTGFELFFAYFPPPPTKKKDYLMVFTLDLSKYYIDLLSCEFNSYLY